jgi:hypothetical protein
VLAYLEEADRHPCRLVMRGTRIAGIITILDIQQLPVRPALFLLVTHLELLMAAVIPSHFSKPSGRMACSFGATTQMRRGKVAGVAVKKLGYRRDKRDQFF